MPNEKTNLLFIFDDQHRWCDFGCYGNKEVITPNFDRFAEDAAVVGTCISNSPLCVPARGTLLTGYMPNKHKAAANDLQIRYDVKSIADILNEAGYHTGYIGKWHLAGVPRNQVIPKEKRLGFNEWKVCNCNHNYTNWSYHDENGNVFEGKNYEAETQTELAIDFLKRNSEKPFALYLSFGPPHNPYHTAPKKFQDLYENLEPTLRPNVLEETYMMSHLPDRNLTAVERDKNFIKEIYLGYYAHISALDYYFGRIVDTLEDLGLSENTLVIFTSDHGDMLGSHRSTDKQLPHDESARVPLIVRQKGKTHAGYIDEIASLVDLPETILSMLRLSFGEKRDGNDLSDMLLNGGKGLDSAYIASYIPCHNAAVHPYGAWRAYRSKKWLYARENNSNCMVLYDIENDPYQLNNLKDNPDYAEFIMEMKKRLDETAALYDDEILSWQDFLVKESLVDEWDKSQVFFGLPVFSTGKLHNVISKAL